MNLARQARSSVSNFLCCDYSQQKFANLIDTSVTTIQGWEQGRRIPRGGTDILLKLIIQSPDYFIPALVQLYLSRRLRFEVSFELASESVQRVMRGNKTQEEKRRATFSLLRKFLRAKKSANQDTFEIINGVRYKVTVVHPLRVIEKSDT